MRKLHHTTAVCAIAAAMLAQPALAQDDSDAEEPTRNVIIVTAQFREQALQDTPLAITAVNAAEIEAKSQTNLVQVADAAPNVSIRPQGTAFGPSVSASIRGIGQNDFNPAFEPGVGIYIDDIYYPQLTGAIFDVLDLDRVEILRGPQGTLSGRNSLGGAIRMYSRKPNGDSSGFAEITYGSRDRIDLRAAADFALTDNLYARISGVSKQQDGYVDQVDFGCRFPAGAGDTFVDNNGDTLEVNPLPGIPARQVTGDDCVVDRLGGVGYQAARAILLWEPSDRFEFQLIGDYIRDEHTVTGEVLQATARNANPNVSPAPGIVYDDRFICGPYCNFQTDRNDAGSFIPIIPSDPFNAGGTPLAVTEGTNRSKYESWGISGQATFDISDRLQLTSITGYREFDTFFFNDADLSPAFVGTGENYLSNWNFSQELRLNAELSDMLFLTVGGYYFEQSSVYDSAQDLRYVPVYPLQFRQPDTVDADARAVFANLAIEPTENLTINAGLRYTEETKDQEYFRLNFDGTINAFLDPLGAANGAGSPGALTGNVASYEGDQLDYRIAVDYRFSDAFLAYASISTGFKGGGSNPRPFNAQQLLAFGPETLTAYEIGFKSDLFDNRVRFNVSAFYNDFTDIQLGVSICPTEDPALSTPSACRLNGGDAEVKGLEAELSAEPIDDFLIDASLSYIDFAYVGDSLNPAAAAPPFGTNNGGVSPDDPGFVPEWKFNIGAQYRIDLGEAGSLTPRLDYQYQAEQFTGAVVLEGVRERQFLPEINQLNGRLTWQNENEDLQIALEVTNITDEYYYLTAFDLRAAGAGFRKVVPSRPREWAVTVRKRF